MRLLSGLDKENLRNLKNFTIFSSIKPNQIKQEKTPTFSKMVRAMLKWCKEHNVSPGGIDQYIKTPMALATSDGLPYKGEKASSSKFSENM